jgi:hypothetical protein
LELGYKDLFEEAGTTKTFKRAVTENYAMREIARCGKQPCFWVPEYSGTGFPV